MGIPRSKGASRFPKPTIASSGLGPRKDRPPQLEGGYETPGRVVGADHRRDLAVETVIVDQIAAGAEGHSHGEFSPPVSPESIDDQVEERAAASGHEQRVIVGERTDRPDLSRQQRQPVEQGCDRGEHFRRAARPQGPLERLHPGEPKVEGGLSRDRDSDRLGHGASAGSAPDMPQLDQHLQRSLNSGRCQVCVQQPHPIDGIHQAHEREVRIVQLCRQPSDRRRVGQLVGEQDPANPCLTHHARLRHGRGGEAIGPRRELAVPQLRCHRGLAVRSEYHAMLVAELLHHPEVVLECRCAQHHDGRRQVLKGQTERPDRAELERASSMGHALGATIERHRSYRVQCQRRLMRAGVHHAAHASSRIQRPWRQRRGARER